MEGDRLYNRLIQTFPEFELDQIDEIYNNLHRAGIERPSQLDLAIENNNLPESVNFYFENELLPAKSQRFGPTRTFHQNPRSQLRHRPSYQRRHLGTTSELEDYKPLSQLRQTRRTEQLKHRQTLSKPHTPKILGSHKSPQSNPRFKQSFHQEEEEYKPSLQGTPRTKLLSSGRHHQKRGEEDLVSTTSHKTKILRSPDLNKPEKRLSFYQTDEEEPVLSNRRKTLKLSSRHVKKPEQRQALYQNEEMETERKYAEENPINQRRQRQLRQREQREHRESLLRRKTVKKPVYDSFFQYLNQLGLAEYYEKFKNNGILNIDQFKNAVNNYTNYINDKEIYEILKNSYDIGIFNF